jgi:hypothetical protein
MRANPGGLLTLLQKHLGWYPLMEPRDVYKLLYQGVMGAEHLMPSREEYTRYLMDEFESLEPDTTGRLLEPLRPDGALYRLNLRPYKARLLGLDQLIAYLLETAHMVTGSSTELHTTWIEFIELCERGQITQFTVDSVQGFGHWLVEMGFPAVHHSDIYIREYRPAYRLISTHFIYGLGFGNMG